MPMLNERPEQASIIGNEIFTTQGMMKLSDLTRYAGYMDDAEKHVDFAVYHFNGKMVHESRHVHLKKWPEGMQSLAGILQ